MASTIVQMAASFASVVKIRGCSEKTQVLDGSDRARLINMRLRLSARGAAYQAKFWKKIHSPDTPLFAERKKYQWALQHWFSFGNEEYHRSWRYSSENCSDDPFWTSIMERMSHYYVDIDDRTDVQSGWHTQTSSYWITADRGASEGAPVSYRRLQTRKNALMVRSSI